MPNPILNSKTFGGSSSYSSGEMAPGWAAGTPAATVAAPTRSVVGAMTINGIILKTSALVVLLLGADIFGWLLVDTSTTQVQLSGSTPVVLLGSLVGALVLGLVTAFAPEAAPITAPLYAVAEGIVVGVISALYNAQTQGVVLQAVATTMGVFVIMLALYTSRAIRVTPRLQMIIIGATVGVMFAYLGIFVASLFTNAIDVFSSGAIGIAFSLLVAGVAGFNLLLDFSFIEQGVQTQAPKVYEWYYGFGLLVTIVWLYLPILRFLGAARR